MPLTEIEKFIFRNNPIAHYIVEFKMDPQSHKITIGVVDAVAVEGKKPYKVYRFEFDNAEITSYEPYDDEKSMKETLWDIIGFDSRSISKNRREFVLHTSEVEYVFISEWPVFLTE